MDQTLGLLGGGDSGCGLGNNETEKDYIGLSSEASSYANEAELELGLGLSLRRSCFVGLTKGKKGSLYEYGRILTAKDLPNALSGRTNAVSAGTKRAADFVSQTENGSPSSTALSQVVGWPPIRAYRMNSLVNQSKVPNGEEEEEEEEKGIGGNEKKDNSKKKINYGNHKNYDDSTIKKKLGHLGFIKANIDGLPIGRKVDLNAHSCYESLAQALEDMFFKSTPSLTSISGEKEKTRQLPKLLDESTEFVLTYEDKEGDWMLVGDVPWGMFLCTVKRLRIMRTSEANCTW